MHRLGIGWPFESDPRRSVLLLDAGPDYALAADLPEDLRNGLDNSCTDHDWAGFPQRSPPKPSPVIAVRERMRG